MKAGAFNSAREKASFDDKKALYKWMPSQTQVLEQHGKWPVISGDWPKTDMFLGRNFQLPVLTIQDEFDCLIARLSINIDELNSYLDLRENYISNLRLEKWIDCKSYLSKIRKKLGSSYWLIENELLIERQIGGEEAQKNLRSKYHNNRELSRRTRYLASFYSERLEPFTMFSGYYLRVNKSIENTKSAAILRHLLTKKIPKNDDELAELICQLNSVPIIDAYESFIKILSCRLSTFVNYSSIILQLKKIDDARLQKQLAVINLSQVITPNMSENEIDELLPSLNFHQYIFGGNNQEAIAAWCYLNPKNTDINHFAIKFENETYASIKISPNDIMSSAHLVVRAEVEDKEISEYLKTEMTSYCDLPEVWAVLSTLNEYFCETAPFSCFRVIDINLPNHLTPFEIALSLRMSKDEKNFTIQGKVKNKIRKLFKGKDGFINDINRMFFCSNYLESNEKHIATKILNDISTDNLPYLVTSVRTTLLIDEKKLEDCFCLASGFSLKYNRGFIQSVFQDKYKELEWQYTKNWKSKLDLCIGIQQLGISKPNSKLQSTKRFAALSFLRSNNFKLPSDLNIVNTECEAHKLAYFLREVCTPETMDTMPLGFKTNLEQLRERMKICESLMGYDFQNSSSIQTEIGELFGQIKLGNAKQSVNSTRLYVDEANLSDYFEDIHKGDYSRIRRLSFAQESNTEEKATEEIVQKFLKGEQDLGDLTLELNNESNAAFFDLVKSYRDNFLENPKYGLNHYLSGRIRHGSFESPFHSIFKELGIWHTSTDNFDVLLTKLERNNVTLEPALHPHIVPLIEKFTLSVYNTLRNIRLENLQIRNDSHPNGFFSVNINPLSLRLLKQHTLDNSEITSWTRLMNQIIWNTLEEKFPQMQNSLRVLLQDKVLQRLENLETELLKLVHENPQKTAIIRLFGNARSQFNKTFSEITAWFQKPKSTSIARYTLDEMFELFLNLFSKAHNIDRLRITRDFDCGETVQHDFSVIYHVFYNIFSNIFKLSEDQESFTVDVIISMHFTEKNILIVKVVNSIPDKLLETSKDMVRQKKSIISSPDFIEGATNEGGSGLIKLFIALGSDPNRYNFFINENDKFEMEFDIDVLRVE